MDEAGAARRAARSEHEGKEVIKYDYDQVRITRKHGRQVSTVTRKRRIATPAKGMTLDLGSLDQELFDKVKSWVNSSSVASDSASSGLSQVPAWVALGMRARTMVEVDGVKEPISLGDAVRSEHWHLWAAAIKKEAAGLILAGLWDEVPLSSVPADSGGSSR